MIDTLHRQVKILIPSFLLLVVGCHKDPFREGKVMAGGKFVSAEVLNEGRRTYMEYCFACHGVDGGGDGVASKGLIPAPRNFKTGIYKFGTVMAGERPTDEDFAKIIRHGLKGTAMLPWDISDDRLDAVIQYIKTLAPEVWEGKDKQLGKPVIAKGNPYGLAHKSAAIQKGKEVYHVVAQCFTCHRAYIPKEEIVSLSKKYPDYAVDKGDLEDSIYKLKLQESDYGVKQLPPDFTWHPIRSATSVDELYVRIAVGVGGTSMPAWKDTLSNEELWAVAHYIRHLMDHSDPSERRKLMSNLEK